MKYSCCLGQAGRFMHNKIGAGEERWQGKEDDYRRGKWSISMDALHDGCIWNENRSWPSPQRVRIVPQ